MNKLTLTVLLTITSLTPLWAKGEKFDRGIEMKTFIPKGQWMVGASFSYMEMDVDNYQWLVLEDFNITGHTFKVSPIVSYFIRDNVSIGGRIAYSRSLMDMGNLAISLGDDLNINLSDYYLKSHMVSTSGFVRTYLNLGDSKRFGLFNEARVTYGYGEGNSENGSSDTSKAVHEAKHVLNFGISPGIVAFVNNLQP